MIKKLIKRSIWIIYLLFFYLPTYAQQKLWHGQERVMNYHPNGQDIVITNGKHRFNRAIYGTNTAFRVEAGNLPEFALYLPGMGGNLKFGLISATNSKWLINTENIEARYRAGSMIYIIHDALLGKGSLTLTILAGAETESMIIKAEFKNVIQPVNLFWAFGGATGKKFSRDGDLGADPESSFYLKPEYCAGNSYKITDNTFTLNFTGKAISEADRYEIKQPGIKAKADTVVDQKSIKGIFPVGALIHIADADKQSSPSDLLKSSGSSKPVITGKVESHNQQPLYFLIQSPEVKSTSTYTALPAFFAAAEASRKRIAGQITLDTPDPYINTLGGDLSIAADAIWESPSYMHGAVAWRMRLNAWRGPYIADVLGWHDRARSHFSSYALSQITSPGSGPVIPDSAMHDARQLEKLGTAMFSSGYISRNPGGKIVPHHYDMNLVFIDELLNHFYWTGDLDYVKKMWPVLKRHLAWEKRNFDADGDGLYDAYCAIWASDALQYSGGGVTHSSAYNYRANKTAAYLAKLIGEDPTLYQKEADHILKAINKTLWLPQTGQYAEYQDLLGLKEVHSAAGLWTVYHAIDEGIADNFQAYQALRYIDTEIPHIPIIAKGAPDGMYTLSTTNWMPYTWSLNNVALAEVLHASLAYWQGNRPEDAFKLWKSSLVQSMYLEDSPGNFDQLSFYDAERGELYRDFGDPIGMAGRSLIEGLFGIHPNALEGTLTIKPGFPAEWDHALLHTPDIGFEYKSSGNTDEYTITSTFRKPTKLLFEATAKTASVVSVTVNGKVVRWKNDDDAVNVPIIRLDCGIASQYQIKITWGGEKMKNASAEKINQPSNGKAAVEIYDPQNIVKGTEMDSSKYGNHTFFMKIKQGDFAWWQPVNTENKPQLTIIGNGQQQPNSLKFQVLFRTTAAASKVIVNPGKNQYEVGNEANPESVNHDVNVPAANLILGSNVVRVEYDNKAFDQTITNWDVTPIAKQKMESVNLSPYFNDAVTNIFKNKYLSPRPTSPTLQLPWQGIGNWCYPLVDVNIDDAGLRKAAGESNTFTIPQGISFATPGAAGKNIIFTSQWDNYPKQVDIPLSGKASHAYFLMAGSTNPMQSRMTNGEVTVTYTDNTTDVLELKNPETWWPIEQDYEDDGYAFQLNAARPIRVYLKSGIASLTYDHYKGIKGYAGKGIDGGAATVLDLSLNPAKELKNLQLKTLSNDVVIGLMSVTLIRE